MFGSARSPQTLKVVIGGASAAQTPMHLLAGTFICIPHNLRHRTKAASWSAIASSNKASSKAAIFFGLGPAPSTAACLPSLGVGLVATSG